MWGPCVYTGNDRKILALTHSASEHAGKHGCVGEVMPPPPARARIKHALVSGQRLHGLPELHVHPVVLCQQLLLHSDESPQKGQQDDGVKTIGCCANVCKCVQIRIAMHHCTPIHSIA